VISPETSAMTASVLDAWAILALLNDEPAAAQVEAALDAGDAAMSWINLGEVLYKAIQRRGETAARAAVEAVQQRVHAELPDEALIRAASRHKARGGISYADCFAVATAERHRAPLLTGDPEIIELGEIVDVIDLRSTA
jgi:uncharacterized protein with PIN domain